MASTACSSLLQPPTRIGTRTFFYIASRRQLHGLLNSSTRHIGTSPRHESATTAGQAAIVASCTPTSKSSPSLDQTLSPSQTPRKGYPLSPLPFSHLARGLFLSAITSSSYLLPLSIRLLRTTAYSKSPFLSPDRNPLVRFLLKHTVYAHFCAGENVSEVTRTIRHLRQQGVNGVMLGCGKELEVRKENARDVEQKGTQTINEEEAEWEIGQWATGTIDTIKMTPEGGFVSIKLTGAGSLVRQHLSECLPPPPLLASHFSRFVSLARTRRISLGLDAEQSTFQPGIDKWALDWASEYNRPSASEAAGPRLNADMSSYTPIFNTYQAYLRSAPERLRHELIRAHKEGWRLGIKLVRGAYLASEPRNLPWASKEETDHSYDGIVEALLKREWTGPFIDANGKALASDREFPDVSLIMATHNAASVRKALALRQEQASLGQKRIPMAYGQLFGMADYVTGELVASTKASDMPDAENNKQVASAERIEAPLVWKYIVWGGVGTCAKYLVRRAEENKDAVGRTVESRKAYASEIWRRGKGVFGL